MPINFNEIEDVEIVYVSEDGTRVEMNIIDQSVSKQSSLIRFDVNDPDVCGRTCQFLLRFRDGVYEYRYDESEEPEFCKLEILDTDGDSLKLKEDIEEGEDGFEFILHLDVDSLDSV